MEIAVKMRALLVYDSTFGNTEQIARTIAEGLGGQYTVQLVSAADSGPLTSYTSDLLVVGGPTQRRHMSPPLRALMEVLPRRGLQGLRAATFDTRYRMTRLLSGSAAREAARALARAGCRLVVPPQSFFMLRDVPPRGEKRRHRLERLEPGEIERAQAWARDLALLSSAPR
jgi:flavodoxin